MGKKQASRSRKQAPPTSAQASPIISPSDARKTTTAKSPSSNGKRKQRQDRPALGRGLCPHVQPPMSAAPPTRLVELLSAPPPPDLPSVLLSEADPLQATLAVPVGIPIEEFVIEPTRTQALLASLSRFDVSAWLNPILGGLAVGWQLCGMQTVVAAEIDPLPTTMTMVLVIALLLASVGMGVPERAMSILQRLLRFRLGSRDIDAAADGGAWLLQGGRDRDPALPSLSLALTSAAAGLAGVATLAVARPWFAGYHWLLEHFFWNSLSLAVLEWACVGLLLACTWILNGLLLITLGLSRRTSMQCDSAHASDRVWPGLILGVAAASILHFIGAGWGLCGEREVLIGALPALALAAMAARSSQRAERPAAVHTPVETKPPELPAEAETRVRMAAAAWGFGVAAAGSGWLLCETHTRGAVTPMSLHLPLLLLSLAIGYVFAVWSERPVEQQGANCGLAVWIAGLGMGLAATFAVKMHSTSLQSVLQIAMLAMPSGFALQRLRHAWLARSPNSALGFAQFSLTVLTGAAIGLAVSRWWGLPHLGSMGTLAAGTLALLATGGLLEIYEDERPLRTQRFRLAMVFASLAAAIAVFPANTRAWTRQQRSLNAAMAVDSRPSAPLIDALGTLRTACLIGTDPAVLPAELPPRLTDVLALPVVSWSTRPTAADARINVLASPALRTLRLGHARFQLVHQLVQSSGRSLPAECSVECLSALATCVTRGGSLMLEVPLTGMGKEGCIALAATFERVCGPTATWTVVEQPSPRIVFRSGHEEPSGIRIMTYKWHDISELAGSASRPPVHSLRRSQGCGTSIAPTALIEWLNGCITQ